MGVLEGKRALITGVGKGVTAASGIARAFAAQGASLALVSAGGGAIQLAKELAASQDATARGFRLKAPEQSGLAEVEELVGEAQAFMGGVDVLVNCTLLAPGGVPLQSLEPVQLMTAFRLGAGQAFLFMRACLPHLKDAQGSVINLVPSCDSLSEMAGQGALLASGEALRALSQAAASEWAAHQVNVNMVSTLVRTSATEAWKEQWPELHQEMVDAIPLGRLGDVQDDLGQACVFLASPAASFITGQLIKVSGGR